MAAVLSDLVPLAAPLVLIIAGSGALLLFERHHRPEKATERRTATRGDAGAVIAPDHGATSCDSGLSGGADGGGD